MDAYKYRAFISYSHLDMAFAERLHAKLETFRIDKALHGVPTPVGPVPPTLRPIFRDKPDLSAGASLSRKLRDALDSSQFLIVICSPAAADSEYVNEEVRYFSRQGRSDRILTFVVDGELGAPIANIFPPAILRQHGAKSGKKRTEEPLAADARKGRDGFEIAQLKIVAGLLGLPLDVIIQRDHQRQAKERVWWHTAVATLAIVATIAAGSAYHSWQTSQRAGLLIDSSLRSTAQLVRTTTRARDDMGITAEAAIELLKSIEHLFNEYGNYDAANPRVRLQRARILLDVAGNYGKLKHTRVQDRMASQALGAMEGLKGRPEIEEAALTLKAEAHWHRGLAYYGDGRFTEALTEFENGLTANAEGDRKFYGERDAPRVKLGPDQYVARARLIHGYVIALMRLDKKKEALAQAVKSMSMGKVLPLDHRNEGDREAAEMLVDARYLAADLIRQLNDRRQELDAEAYINEGLQDAERLRQYHPKRTRLRSKVATMHLARGDLRRWRADRVGALEDYRLSKNHREHLMKADASDLTLKADFAFSLIKVGEELNALRRPEEAITELETAEALYAELRSARPHDRSYRHWQWTTIQGLGDAFRLSKNSKAIDYHRRKLAIARERHQEATGSIDALLTVAESHLDFGDALIARGGVEDGVDNLTSARRLLKPAADDPAADWRLLRLQARVLEAVARSRLTARDYADAREAADEAFALRDRERIRAGKIDPHGQAELAENRRLVGSIQLGVANCEEAKRLYEQAVLVLDRLVREHTPNPEWREKFDAARNSLSAITWKDGSLECSDQPVDSKVRDMIAMARQLLH